MIKEKMIGAVNGCYRYTSIFLLGQPSINIGRADFDSDKHSGKVDVSKTGRGVSLPDTRNVFSLAWPLAVNAIMLNGIVIVGSSLVSTLGQFMTSWARATGIFVGQLLGRHASAGSIDSFSAACGVLHSHSPHWYHYCISARHCHST